MKLAKLSLAAMVVAGLASSSFAADTLADAFAKGKVSGTLETQYIDQTFEGTKVDTNGFAVGGELKFVTDTINGFGAGFTFQTSHTLGTESSVALENDTTVNIQETMLSEAYLTYTMKNTMVKVGRMYLATPLVSSSGSRIMMDYFTGGIIVNTDLPQTTVIVGAVKEWTQRSNARTHLEDMIYTGYVQNKSIAGLTLTGQFSTIDDVTAAGNDGRDDYYAEFSYKLPIAFPLTVGAQYLATDYSASATQDAAAYGLMVGTAVAGVTLEAFYNDSTKDGQGQGGWGHGKDPSYNDMWLDPRGAPTVPPALMPNMQSYSFKAGYAFTPELSAFVQYGVFDQDNGNANDFNMLDFDVMYKPGYFKGLSLNAKYSTVDNDVAASPDVESHLYFFAKYAF